jgi:hypothetical protein
MASRFSTDPAFYLDLLQFLASFLSANPEEFGLLEDRRFGIEMAEEAPRVFCGGRQAHEFVRGFSFHDQLFSNLAMNPLFGRPDLHLWFWPQGHFSKDRTRNSVWLSRRTERYSRRRIGICCTLS